MSLQQGTKLGPYEVVNQIGVGGMGEVYRAIDTRLDRTVAIKVLPTHLSSIPDFRQRFEREARAVSKLNHAHICTLHDVGHHNGTDFIVMEYLEGETLLQRLTKGPLPTSQAVRYGIEIADALDKAHRNGIVHRDLKPGNIMLTTSGVKLLDFGLAKLHTPDQRILSDVSAVATEADARHLTAEGSIVGTFQYMAPEQLEGKEIDARTDIFAFGTVLYEMLTGKKAFTATSQASLIAAILEKEPQPISEIQPMTPPALDRVVKTCLEKNPEDRWQTAHDAMLQLKWIAEAGSKAGVPAPVIAKRKFRELFAWLLAAGALITTLLFALLWYRATVTPPPVLTMSLTAPEKVEMQTSEGIALSPNGQRMVFAGSRQNGKNQLWVRNMDSLEAHALEGTEGAYYPFWSPDSKDIGFFADGKLKRIDATSGSLQTVCSASDLARGGTWNEEGVIVYSPNYRAGLYKVSASGGEPSPVTQLDEHSGEKSHRWPWFLPDGKHLLFLSQTAEGGVSNDRSTIQALDLNTAKRTTLISGNTPVMYSRSGHILFWKEGTLFAQPFDVNNLQLSKSPFSIAERIRYTGNELALFTISDTGLLVYQEGEAGPTNGLGTSQLVWVDRKGKRLDEITPSPGRYDAPTISHNGSRIAYERDGDIWIRDLQRGTETRLTFYDGADYSPVWSPDDGWVLWSSDRTTNGEIYRKRSSGVGEEEKVYVDPKHQVTVRDYSQNGKLLSFNILGEKTLTDIFLFSFENHQAKAFAQTPRDESELYFSPDNKWVLYNSNESGRWELYVRPLSGDGERWLISVNGGEWGRWSRDGREIFYTNSGKMVSVKVDSTKTFQTSLPEVLFDLPFSVPEDLDLPYFDVSPDGRFVFNWPLQARTVKPLTVVYNWNRRN